MSYTRIPSHSITAETRGRIKHFEIGIRGWDFTDLAKVVLLHGERQIQVHRVILHDPDQRIVVLRVLQKNGSHHDTYSRQFTAVLTVFN